MRYRQLGRSGVRVSVIGLGTNRFGAAAVQQPQVDAMIDAAAELGINFLDTSNGYQEGRSETMLGQALKRRWQQFFVATKFFYPTGNGPNDRGTSRYHMANALEGSLRRLQTDHIDLYYVHRWDATTPIEETLRALDDVIRQGKVRYVGASSFASWQLAHANLLAEFRGWSPFVVVQSQFHMLERLLEREVLAYCQAHQVGFVPYYPLAGGFLTGKYRQGEPPPRGSRGENTRYVRKYMTESNYRIIEKLRVWADERGRGLNELAQSWLLAQPQVCSVISGATRLEQLLGNARAADWVLSESELEGINKILEKTETGEK